MRYAPTALALCLAACHLSAAPLTISGPDRADPYRLVVLVPENADPDAAAIWDIEPADRADVRELPDGSVVFTGQPGTYRVKLRTIKGKVVTPATKVVVIGPAAPVVVNPPIPTPTPTPVVNPPAGPLSLVVVYDALTVESAKLLDDIAFWDGLGQKRVKYSTFDANQEDAKAMGYDDAARAVGFPAMLLIAPDPANAKKGSVVASAKLPADKAGVLAFLQQNGR